MLSDIDEDDYADAMDDEDEGQSYTVGFENDGEISDGRDIPHNLTSVVSNGVDECINLGDERSIVLETTAGLYQDEAIPSEKQDIGVTATTTNKSVSAEALNSLKKYVDARSEFEITHVSVS